ncbi:MAG: glycosyltransferase family 4 protein [Armatimonadota bacterium]|nr:glycosyltransferase family 4 protein [Armatimonadota bacterium]
MRTLIMYEYPPPPAGLATQGDLLYKGLCEIGEDCRPVHLTTELQKEWLYKWYKPQVAIGVGWWGQIPSLVLHPRQFGVEAVPWLVADGWVANYQDVLNSLPLILTTSKWVLDTYVRDGVSAKNMVSQPIGCDVKSFRPLPRSHPEVRAVREALGVAEDEKLILTIGGDGASKGSREMMRALATVNQSFKKWKYVCKVWFQERTEKQNRLDMELAEQLGIRDKVTYIDGVLSREFMPFIYNACDIYAGPSRQEGFGMPHVEAQACGKPVLSVDAMGIKETVIHKETGFLADIADVVALKEGIVDKNMGYPEKAIIKFEEPKVIAVRASVPQLAEYALALLSDDSLAAKMGAAAREHARANFDYKALARRVADLVRERVPQAANASKTSSGNGGNGNGGKRKIDESGVSRRADSRSVGAGQKGSR